MTLRRKTLLTVGLPIVVAMGLLYFILSNVWLSRTWRVELREGEHNAGLVARMIASRIDRYEHFTQDWAAWDDAYQFLHDRNAGFIASNLGDDTLDGLGLSYMLYLDRRGKLLMGRGHDVERNRPRPVPGSLLALLQPGSPLLDHKTSDSHVSGLVSLPDGPLLIVTQPIVRSDRTGPPRGKLVFARYLDEQTLTELAETAALSITLRPLKPQPNLPPAAQTALSSLLAGSLTATTAPDARTLVSYRLLKDLYGQPAGLLEVAGSRAASQLAADALQAIMVALLSAGAICVLSVLYFTQRHVVARMEQLGREVGEVAASADPARRVTALPGSDELSLLSGRINDMLQALDVAENRRLEDRQRYQAVTEQIAEGVAIIDVETGRCLEANAALHAMLGYDPGELTRLGCPDFYLNLGMTRQRLARQCREGARQPALETEFRRRDGSWLPVEAACAVAGSGGQEVLGIVARDITARKQAEAERLALQATLQRTERMEAISQLAAGLAHNFNNILGAILGTVDLCLKDADPRLETRLRTIERSTQRAADLVKQFTVFSRHAEPSREPVSLAAAVAEVADICRQTFDRRITISVQDMTSLPPVYADRGQIHQVLLNLCLNARDALAADGELGPDPHLSISAGTLSITVADVARTKCRCGPHVKLVVADNGVGMTAEVRDRIFEPFFTTKEVGIGTGLGLASVYGIITAHEGHVECHSQPGQGARFEVYLPVSAAPVEREAAVVPRALRGAGETILLVDDEPEIRNLGSEILARYGYEVLTAEDGRDGLDVFTQYAPAIDLVLLDLTMPRMSGQDLMREMLARAPETRIVIITGHAEPSVSLEQAQALLPKPFGIYRLLETIRSVLQADPGDPVEHHGPRLL